MCAAWSAFAVLAVVASALPGIAGRMAAGVALHAVPAVVRRGVAAAVGASIVLTPVAASAASPGGHQGGPAATAASGPSPAGPRPAATRVSGASPRVGAGAVVSGGWPWPTSTSTDAQVSTTSAAPVPWPHSAARAPGNSDVVVRPGDCLWAIAAHRLGPQASGHRIAAESRRWYGANAAVIGADPDLIHPGQHLHYPTEKGHRS